MTATTKSEWAALTSVDRNSAAGFAILVGFGLGFAQALSTAIVVTAGLPHGGVAAFAISTVAATALLSPILLMLVQKAKAPSQFERVNAILDHAILRHEIGNDGRIVSANRLMCQVTGYSEAELIGQSHQLLKPDMIRPWLELHTEIRKSELWSGETLLYAKDGAEIWLSSTIAAIRDLDGCIKGYTCLSIDVSERRKARDELLRNSKLMHLGQLTATVAHEIRNPLGAIRTASFVLERKIRGQVEGVGPQLERINNGIQRCDKIITELLDVSRIKVLKTKRLTVDEWVSLTVTEEARTLVGNPEIVYDLRLGAIEADFDPDQMRQVLINLLSNAAEAMTERSKSSAVFRPVIQISTQAAGAHVEIVVTDNGPGIEPKNLKRIREPLFTTKSFGVGLGIPAIERILENHGGYLEINSVVGHGATVVAGFKTSMVNAVAA